MDFSPTGANTGIKYSEAFKQYKKILSANPDSPQIRRIFSEFNSALFGNVPTTSCDPIAEDGDYALELARFEVDFFADPQSDHADDEMTLPDIDDLEDPEIDDVQPALTDLVQPERRVSISVTSHVSKKTVETSSQVSKVVSGHVDVPSIESEVEEAPPPALKATRPAPKKKGSTKSSTATKKAKGTPTDPPTRTLRNRG